MWHASEAYRKGPKIRVFRKGEQQGNTTGETGHYGGTQSRVVDDCDCGGRLKGKYRDGAPTKPDTC